MPRNGSGTYTLPAGNPVVTGTTISSTWANTTLSDIGTGLTNSIAKDGQTTPTANLPMGGFKHTGVAVAAATTDYARADQVQNSTLVYLTSVSGADTITASAPLTLSAYAAGQKFHFIAAGANTGTVTLNINGIGAKAVTKNGTTALIASEITNASIVEVVYDGTQFQLISLTKVGTAANNILQLNSSGQLPAIDGSLLTNINASSKDNKFINGSFYRDQRNSGAAQTFTAGGVLAYSVDRWYGYCTGANVTGQQVAGTAPNQYNYRFTGAASVTKIGFAQRIEAADSQDLAGTTASLSVDLANSLLTTVTWTAWYATSTDSFGTLASPTRTQIATGTFTVTSTLTRYSTQISVPSAATTGIEVEFSVGAQTSGTWTIGRAQLESGSSATSFQVRPVGEELALCQRFYERGGNWTNSTADQSFRAAYSGASDWPVRYTTTKRAAASVTVYSPSTQAADRWRDASAGADVVATIPTSTISGFITQATTTAANAYSFTWQASSEL